MQIPSEFGCNSDIQSTCPFLDALPPRRLPLICPEDGRWSRLGPLFFLQRGGQGAGSLLRWLLYTKGRVLHLSWLPWGLAQGFRNTWLKSELTERICIIQFKTICNESSSMYNGSSGRSNGDVIPRGGRWWAICLVPDVLLYPHLQREGCPRWPSGVTILDTSVDSCHQFPTAQG